MSYSKRCGRCYECKRSCNKSCDKCCPCEPGKPIVEVVKGCEEIFKEKEICKHECVDHGYNFEAKCGQGVPDPFPDCKGKLHLDRNENYKGSITVVNGEGVPNLGCYVRIEPPENPKLHDQWALQICGLNVNPCGFSVSLWYNILGNLSDTYQLKNKDARLFSKAFGKDANEHIFAGQIVGEANNVYRFRLKTENGFFELKSEDNEVKADSLWHHLVFWYDGCEMRIYKDGMQLKSVVSDDNEDGVLVNGRFVATGKVLQTSDKTGVGSQPVGKGGGIDGMRLFNGCLDQLIFWNTPLNREAITALSCAGFGGICKPGFGTTTMQLPSCGVVAKFDKKECCRNYLTAVRLMLDVTTCGDLCNCFLAGCERISVVVEGKDGKDGKGRYVLAEKVNDLLKKWPGIIETLCENESKDCPWEIKTSCKEVISCGPSCPKTDYVIRLNLNIPEMFGCPIDVTKKEVKVLIENVNNIKEVRSTVLKGFKKCKKKRSRSRSK